jgi:hypothetical protein
MEQPGQKRKASSLGDDEGSMVLAKRPKTDSDDKSALAKTDTRNKNEIMKVRFDPTADDYCVLRIIL